MINFFNPQSVAVVGASANKKKLGYQLLKNLIDSGYEGRIYPVNLEEKVILGHKVFQNILDVHSKVDLVTIIVPREIVPTVLKQCVAKGVPYVLIISAGFAEKDAAGKKLQKGLLDITAGSNTRIIGPNCLGIINANDKLNLTFAATEVVEGGLGLILQSGAIGAAILDWAKENEIGISKFVSLGNKVHTSEIEAIKILGDDPQTKIIGLYLEEISEPIRFLRLCREITIKKPIVILKGGTTELGAKAASSHTAALATSNKLDKALFLQANLIMAEDYSEFLNLFELLSFKNFDGGKNLAIISNAGGPGILAADAAAKAGFKLPTLTGNEKTRLEDSLRSYASLTNPFDLGGDAQAESYQKIMNLIVESPAISSLLVIVTPQSMTEIEKTARVLTKFRKNPKPVIASFLGGLKIKSAKTILMAGGIPHFEDPAMAIEMLAKVHRYFERRNNITPMLDLHSYQVYKFLTEQDLIKKYDIAYIKSETVTSDSEVMAFVEANNFPIAFKTGKVIKHKGRSGKVGLNINDNRSLIRIAHRIGYPAIVQKMVDSPYELMIGARRDPTFGIVIILGQGGIFVEEKADIAIKMLPLTVGDVDEMIESTNVWRMIRRFKVKGVIKKTILAVAKLMMENPDICSIEFNPFKVLQSKIIAVDINIGRENG